MIVKDTGSSGSRPAAERNEGWVPAYLTVEATLLMGIILPVLTAVLIASFYVHDQACLQGSACEIASMGCNLAEYPDRAARLERLCSSLPRSRLLWSRSVQAQYTAGDDAVSGGCSGTFPVSSLIRSWWQGGPVQAGASWSRAVYHPADLIRKVRGVHELIEALEG